MFRENSTVITIICSVLISPHMYCSMLIMKIERKKLVPMKTFRNPSVAFSTVSIVFSCSSLTCWGSFCLKRNSDCSDVAALSAFSSTSGS